MDSPRSRANSRCDQLWNFEFPIRFYKRNFPLKHAIRVLISSLCLGSRRTRHHVFPVVDRFAYFCPFPTWTNIAYNLSETSRNKKNNPCDCPLGHEKQINVSSLRMCMHRFWEFVFAPRQCSKSAISGFALFDVKIQRKMRLDPGVLRWIYFYSLQRKRSCICHGRWIAKFRVDFPPRATSLIGVKKNLPRKFSRKVQSDSVNPPL